MELDRWEEVGDRWEEVGDRRTRRGEGRRGCDLRDGRGLGGGGRGIGMDWEGGGV